MANRLVGASQARTGWARWAVRAAWVVVVAFGAGACDSASRSTAPTSSSSTTTVTAAPAADAIIAQVVVRGGFISSGFLARRVPSVTVFGDGSVVTPGAVPEIVPGPAITPLELGHIPAARVARLIVEARRLGLLGGPLDFGRPSVSDLGTTIVRISDGAHPAAVHSAYAFGFDPVSSGLTGAQRAARRALQLFVGELQALPRGAGIFTPRAIAVFSLTGTSSGPVQSPRPWPIATRPRSARDEPACVVVSGAEVAPLVAALAHANENTPWIVGGHPRWLAFRPLAATDDACTL